MDIQFLTWQVVFSLGILLLAAGCQLSAEGKKRGMYDGIKGP